MFYKQIIPQQFSFVNYFLSFIINYIMFIIPFKNLSNFLKKCLLFSEECANISRHLSDVHAPIAQLDRVTDYESVGRGFESLSAYQKPDTHLGIWFFIIPVNFESK